MTSFTRKLLRFTFVLSNNAVFEGTGSNTLTVTGLRATVNTKGSGLPAFPEAEGRINGLRQDDMNALTALANVVSSGSPLPFQRNTVLIEADSGNGQGWSTVFAGQIVSAGPDYTGAPDVALRFFARAMFFESINPANVTSYTGATDVATIVSAIAAKIGKVVENNGVEGIMLDSPYFAGTLGDQLKAVAEQAGIDVYNEFSDNVIAICPKGQPRRLPTWELSPASGLVGYPTLDSRGFIQAHAIYNPAFRFGGRLTIRGSDVPRANGEWLIGAMSNQLETIKPGGNWFSDLLCYPPGQLPAFA